MGTTWKSAEGIAHSSVVGGGTMLLDEKGKCIGQVMILNVAPDLSRKALEEEVTQVLKVASVE